jgi:CRP-like cAMP-binding protein
MIDLDTACADLPVECFGDNEVVVAEGETSKGLYFLKSGKVAAYRGKELIAEIERVGSTWGDVSALLDCPALAEARSVGNSSFYVVTDVDAFFGNRPELLLHVTRDLAKKLNFMSSYLTDLKQQYAGHSDHLGMVHQVLDSFLHED